MLSYVQIPALKSNQKQFPQPHLSLSLLKYIISEHEIKEFEKIEEIYEYESDGSYWRKQRK